MPISTATEFEELVGSDSDATVKRVHSQIRSYVGNNQNSQDAEVLDQVKAISPVLAVTQDLKRTSPDDLWREHEETILAPFKLQTPNLEAEVYKSSFEDSIAVMVNDSAHTSLKRTIAEAKGRKAEHDKVLDQGLRADVIEAAIDRAVDQEVQEVERAAGDLRHVSNQFTQWHDDQRQSAEQAIEYSKIDKARLAAKRDFIDNHEETCIKARDTLISNMKKISSNSDDDHDTINTVDYDLRMMGVGSSNRGKGTLADVQGAVEGFLDKKSKGIWARTRKGAIREAKEAVGTIVDEAVVSQSLT